MNHINNGKKEHISIKVQIGFGKDDRIAAFADKSRDGEYIVEVNMPSYFIIYSFCHCIVLQEIYPIISYDNNENKRGFYAELLTAIMLDILLYHEIGHIVNGHIDYIKDKEILEIGCKKIYRDRKAVKIYVEFYSFLYIIKVTETI